jgi:sugar phosphate isomerase/epimerase
VSAAKFVTVRVASPPVLLSTSSCFPEPAAGAFELASSLGFDGLEVMVFTDPVSQSEISLLRLIDQYQIPVLSVHAPCLLVTQRVWGKEPWGKVERSIEMAQRLGSPVVVLHPPFRWQREYAATFVERVNQLSEDSGVAIAVENMYPWRVRSREIKGYLPDPFPAGLGYRHVTLDLSHTAASNQDPLLMMQEVGDSLTHVHLGDGSGAPRDEHLVPGRGNQPCGEVLSQIRNFPSVKSIAIEVSTRRAASRDERIADLKESLEFARSHLQEDAS